MQRQLKFAIDGKRSDSFGGSLLKNGNPRTKRPLDSKLPTHLVLRAIKSGMRNPTMFAKVNQIVQETNQKYGVTMYKYSNNGNHLHLLIKIPRIWIWARYIKELTGRIARLMREHLQLDESFWLHRPFTRVVRGWKKAFQIVKDYIHLNVLEAEGFIDRRQTKTLRDLEQIWGDSVLISSAREFAVRSWSPSAACREKDVRSF